MGEVLEALLAVIPEQALDALVLMLVLKLDVLVLKLFADSFITPRNGLFDTEVSAVSVEMSGVSSVDAFLPASTSPFCGA